VFDPNGKTVDELVKFASDKGQVLLVQRNLKDGDDTFCIEASKRYILFKTSLMKAGLSIHHTKQSVGTGNASGPNATPETNRSYDTGINSFNSSTINSWIINSGSSCNGSSRQCRSKSDSISARWRVSRTSNEKGTIYTKTALMSE